MPRRAPVLALILASLAGATFNPTGLALDRVRAETRVDQAATKYGITGRNVLVAILDRGLDWKHPDFRHPDGTTRLEFIFDLTDDSGQGAPDNPYRLGTIYTKDQIAAALESGASLATRDAVGHGTTTTGIACGGGRLNPLYRGIAPEAKIIVVKITSDGAPAHDNEPAEAPFYDPARIPVAIDFVTDKATALGLPVVMLLNIGSVGGPTDGTSALCRKVDAAVGPGIPGRAFITGTSDDGSAPNRASGTVEAGQTITLEIQKETTGSLFLDLWYSETDRFEVAIATPGGTFGPYPAPDGDTGFQIEQTADFLYYHLGASADFYNAANDRREIWIRLDGPPGLYQMELTGVVAASGRFDATLNPSRFDPSGAPINRFLNWAAPGSIWDLATASNNICPNSYVIRTNYIDIDQIPRQIVGEGAVGGLWKGSGVGPTFDGRLGVDVSAPGDSLFTSYNPRSHWATFRFNLIEGGNGHYGRASAVSAANPIVTGIVALMLEMDPTLDAPTIKRILQETARADSFTGSVPNPMWGYGKVDALAALDRVHAQRPRLDIALPSAQIVQVTARGRPGQIYRVEASTDLRGWHPIATNTTQVNPFSVNVPIDRAAQFFRLTQHP